MAMGYSSAPGGEHAADQGDGQRDQQHERQPPGAERGLEQQQDHDQGGES
jgi:hypothetical protein